MYHISRQYKDPYTSKCYLQTKFQMRHLFFPCAIIMHVQEASYALITGLLLITLLRVVCAR